MEREDNRLWDYKIVEEIGRGQNGIVYKVFNNKQSIIQALKRVAINNMTVTACLRRVRRKDKLIES